MLERPYFKSRADIACLTVCIIVASAFCFSESLRAWYMSATAGHPFLAGFCKFAILATFGESLAQRILRGQYIPEDFYPVPRALLWGLLGVAITAAFAIFAAGAPQILVNLGLPGAADGLAGPLSLRKLAVAFTVSVTINCMFAPGMMVVHKLGDMVIAESKGKFLSMRYNCNIGKLLGEINWKIMWKLVFYRSIVFFWIPAHTITFLLPPAFRVLFAAILGAVLGLILAWAAHRQRKTGPQILM